MLNKTVSISVVIPAYNAEKVIDRAINSVLNQTTRPAEILVIDDGSGDGTAPLVKGYGTAVRYLHQKNAGPGAARNLGIYHAASEWIAFLDADDEWLPHKIDSQWRVLEEHPDLKWCSAASEDIVNGVVSHGSTPGNLKDEDGHCRGLSFFLALAEGIRFGTPSLVIRKSVFGELGGFDAEMPTGEDKDMWWRIALKYPRIGYCYDVCWYWHHDNPNSASRRGHMFRDRQLQSLCRNMRYAMELGPEAVSEFRPYARMKAKDYLIRAAGGDCFVEPETIKEATGLFPLTVGERTLLKMLGLLPKPMALKVVSRLTA